MVFQSPIILMDTYMRLMATKQQPHLVITGKEGTRRSMKVYPYMYLNCTATVANIYFYVVTETCSGLTFTMSERKREKGKLPCQCSCRG